MNPEDGIENLDQIYRVQKEEKTFICEICNNKFSKKSSIKQHVATVHGNKSFKCKVCNASFLRNRDMKRHNARVHKGQKQFECDLCNVQLSRNEHLKRHIQPKGV